jgi:hypothetical protein
MAIAIDARDIEPARLESALVDVLPHAEHDVQPQDRHLSLYARLHAMAVSFFSDLFSPKPTSHSYRQPMPSAVDQLARSHPYIYIKAMSG